jgi:predicted RNase H-like HicB family nuclease
MDKSFTLEYWIYEDWYIGRLKEVPGVFSQAETLEELKDNIREVYHLMLEDAPDMPVLPGTAHTEIEVRL